jgi:hypothetical protein
MSTTREELDPRTTLPTTSIPIANTIGDIDYKVYKSKDFRAGRVGLMRDTLKIKVGNARTDFQSSLVGTWRIIKCKSFGNDTQWKVWRLCSPEGPAVSYHQCTRWALYMFVSPPARHFISLSIVTDLGRPIMTYGGQGTLKKGVHSNTHAIIYNDEPLALPREVLTNVPIKAEAISPRHKLDPVSRLNYAKCYTVEYNVKVRPIYFSF